MIGPLASVQVHLARAMIIRAVDLGRQVWQAVVDVWPDKSARGKKTEAGLNVLLKRRAVKVLGYPTDMRACHGEGGE